MLEKDVSGIPDGRVLETTRAADAIGYHTDLPRCSSLTLDGSRQRNEIIRRDVERVVPGGDHRRGAVGIYLHPELVGFDLVVCPQVDNDRHDNRRADSGVESAIGGWPRRRADILAAARLAA